VAAGSDQGFPVFLLHWDRCCFQTPNCQEEGIAWPAVKEHRSEVQIEWLAVMVGCSEGVGCCWLLRSH